MSMSILLLLAIEKSPNIDELNKKAKELNIPIVYDPSIEVKSHSGFYPLKLNNEKSGFEIYVIDDIGKLKNSLPQTGLSIDYGAAYQFRFGFQHNEGPAAFYTAAVITATYDGVAFDPQSGHYLNQKQLIQAANELLDL